jgi:hypothetical protein
MFSNLTATILQERMTLGVDRSTLLQGAFYQHIAKVGIHGWDRWTYCDQLRAAGLHPTSSCAQGVIVHVLPKILKIALQLYGPLYLAWNVFKLRLPQWSFLFQNIARSTIFLTGYTLSQYYLTMLFTSTLSPTMSRNQMATFCWLGGLFTLVERPERRPELAHYCLAHALNSIFIGMRDAGVFKRVHVGFAYLLLSLASGILTHFHKQHAPFVRMVFGFDAPAKTPAVLDSDEEKSE